jgi:hypothetical protein
MPFRYTYSMKNGMRVKRTDGIIGGTVRGQARRAAPRAVWVRWDGGWLTCEMPENLEEITY